MDVEVKAKLVNNNKMNNRCKNKRNTQSENLKECKQMSHDHKKSGTLVCR